MSKEVYIKTYQKVKSYNYSLLFDGTKDSTSDYIQLPALGFNGTNVDITFEGWLNVNDTSGIHDIFGIATDERFGIRLESGNLLKFFSKDAGGTFNNGGGYFVNLSSYYNNWVHIAVVYTYTDKRAKIYCNGILVDNTVQTNPIGFGSNMSGSIGTSAFYNPYKFKGWMSEIRIWSFARTAQQIRDNMFVPLSGSEFGLAAYYKLNEGLGTTATDFSGNSRNGTLTNFSGSYWVTSTIVPLYSRIYKGFSQDYAFDSISSQVNSGYGSLNFTLPRQFDVLQSQDPQNLENYELDVVAYDNESTLGITLFSGEVVIAERKLSGSGESVVYTAVSPLERMEKIDLTDSDVIVTYSNIEIGAIFKDIIDKCNAKAQQQILKYTSSSIQNTGKNITQTFSNAFVADCLKSVFKSTDDNWIWYVDVDRTVYLRPINSIPDHYFFNTKDISSVSRTTDKSKVVNVLKLWDGETSPTVLRQYQNQDSIDTYGYRAEAIQDGRYGTVTGALEYGKRYINTNKNPNDQLEFNIIDSSGGGFDIDSIKVGDSFKALNFGTKTNLPNLMVVTSKIDYLDYAIITASDRIDFVSRELVNLKKDQFQVNMSDHPATPYTVEAV